jgi:hypothetical protein
MISFGLVSAFAEPVKYSSSCPELSETHHIDFSRSIETPDLAPNAISNLKGISSFYYEPLK